jgi:CubicO group peptidase (beta-lactamase class C family)
MIELADARQRKHSKTDWSLLGLLEHFQKSVTLATRPRERLFAPLGMTSDAADPRFDPDYEEPIGKVLSVANRPRFGSDSQALSWYRPAEEKLSWESVRATRNYKRFTTTTPANIRRWPGHSSKTE